LEIRAAPLRLGIEVPDRPFSSSGFHPRFKDQSDADSATFSLVRDDNQKKILDHSSQKVRKTGTLKPVTWELNLDDDIIKDALTDDEMQCKVSVSVTAVGKAWTPVGRNKITVTAKDKDGGTISGARCTCTIKAPPDFFSKTKRVPHTVATKDDGTAELFLDAPGDLDIEWHFPYYPQDNAAWTSAKGAQREVTLLERERTRCAASSKTTNSPNLSQEK